MALVLNEQSTMVATGWNGRRRDCERRLEGRAIWERVEDILR
jgi:hypothetical protein